MEESPVLVDAIEALQIRAKELEDANNSLRREITVIRQKLHSQQMRNERTNSNLITSAEKVTDMLSSATDTLVELRQIKRQNRQLKKAISIVESQLGEQLKQNILYQKKTKQTEEKAKNLKEMIHEYDSMFFDLLMPEPPKGRVAPLRFNLVTSGANLVSIPSQIQLLIQKLQSHPTDFSHQTFAQKKIILSTLRDAKSKIEALQYDIQDSPINTSNSRQKEKSLSVKKEYIDALSAAMNRFQLSPYG